MRRTGAKTEHCNRHGPRFFFMLRVPQCSINSIIGFRDIYGICGRDEPKDLSIKIISQNLAMMGWGGVGRGRGRVRHIARELERFVVAG